MDNKMKVEDFNYELPEELIAQFPAKKRDESRLMVIHRDTGEIEHRSFYDVVDYLKSGDCLVLNNSKVLPARIFGKKKGTGAAIEFLIVRRIEGDKWITMVRPGRRVKPGDTIIFSQDVCCDGDPQDNSNVCNNSDPQDNSNTCCDTDFPSGGKFEAEVLDYGEDGTRIVEFHYDGIFMERLEELGNMPLPPYIERENVLEDRDRYQTVYCNPVGSVAAPTAGLHFTEELLEKAKEKGVEIVFVTLHVGIGTFRPVKVDDVEDHHMHFEEYVIDKESAEKINRAKRENRRVISVGTTSTRTLESAAVYDEKEKMWQLESGEKSTGIFIYPGYEFKIIDSQITNFHLPKSTLLMLVSAFYDREKMIEAYEEAIKEKYRFFSYGDAMLIL